MRVRQIAVVGAAVLAAISSASGYTNPLENQTTETITNLWDLSGEYEVLEVGRNTWENRMFVEGGRVESGTGSIGWYSSASNNLASVNGAGSVWHNSGYLTVGGAGSGNHLSIADGGRVETFCGQIGFYSNSCNNVVGVNGAGSFLDISSYDLLVGLGGSGNHLTIFNGGRAESYFGYIGHSSSSSNNVASVSGSGSAWEVESNLHVGREGSGNLLVIAEGGRVGSATGSIGSGVISSNNEVIVRGDFSRWINSSDLSVGFSGSNNRLSIEDHAWAHNLDGYVGREAGSCNNQVSVRGMGSVWLNDGDLFLGYRGSNNQMSISTPGGGGVVNSNAYIGYLTTSESNAISVSGTGSSWVNSADLYVGHLGSGNSLSISDGGRVVNRSGYVGYGTKSSNNTVVISGSGSVWSNSSWLALGSTGNRLMIHNGGQVQSSLLRLGTGSLIPGGSNNFISVSGVGSLMSVDKTIYFGNGNELSITAGGYVESNDGGHWDGSGSTVTVSGSGSLWKSNGLQLGIRGSGNNLSVAAGGKIESESATIGRLSESSNNTVIVSGAGSVLLNEDVWVGEHGSSNRLLISEGGQVEKCQQLILGYYSNSCNNVVSVYGSGAVADNRQLFVGLNGTSNYLTVYDSGQVNTWIGYIGYGSNSFNNGVIVSGEGSQWNISAELNIGNTANFGNHLIVSDGGKVTVGGAMRNESSSVIDLKTDGKIWTDSTITVGGSYHQDATSTLRFGCSHTWDGDIETGLLQVGGTATLEAGATVECYSVFGNLSPGRIFTNMIVEADSLVVGGIYNATTEALTNLSTYGTLLNVDFMVQDQNIYAILQRLRLSETAGFTLGASMATLCDEIDALAFDPNSNARTQLTILDGMPGSKQKAQLLQLYDRSTPNYQHMRGMLMGAEQAKKRSARFLGTQQPDGAAGPHVAEQPLQGWAKAYGNWGNRNASGEFLGYDQSVYGTVVGLDKAVHNVLFGIAGGYAGSSLSQDDGDDSDAKTSYGLLYASLGTKDWFGDFDIGYGMGPVETSSGTDFDTTGSTDANIFTISGGGGWEFALKDRRYIVTPEAALRISQYSQDGYTETSTTAEPRMVDAYDRWSYLSSIGATFAVPFEHETFVLLPEVRAHWLHEFNADEEEIGYSLIGGTDRFAFSVLPPEEDLFRLGASFGARFHNRWQASLGFDLLFGSDSQSTSASGRIAYEF